MLFSRLAIFALAILTESIVALPTSGSIAPIPRPGIEIWHIPTMELHMMTRHSGLPGGGGWPESTKFPSTMDFDIIMPNNQSTHCYIEFANGTLPSDPAVCTGEMSKVIFRLSEYAALGPRRKELSFVLEVFKLETVA
ncbi:hypothetical protein C7974DRAFT_401122 [Boeremia exigua]|uniref:uncharacterized protein n=1 Tax=Boeremia exigua TaxID=749465 RepID=UPI001E8E922C|nr:uncharacterized protein C7974DRAFT_401122 [Boeremia exigua]KAH6618910.1 hypothetical protein C7974DRAFT_401122 [Boeremia exigua]